MRIALTTLIAAFALGGCSGWSLEPADKAPQNDYEKRIYQQEDALKQQQATMLNT
jgi:PBP1b-binding outer membrane lipoprotein LpoB